MQKIRLYQARYFRKILRKTDQCQMWKNSRGRNDTLDV